MNCPLRTVETADLLLDYSAGRLDSANSARLEGHMQTCPDCAAFRIEQGVVWSALDEWEPAPVSLDFNRRLWQRIDAASRLPWYRVLAESLKVGHWRPLLPLTAAALVIAAGFFLDHPADRPVYVPGVSVHEADQVEQTLDDIQLLHQLDAVTAPNGNPQTM